MDISDREYCRSAAYIKEHFHKIPDAALVLGSGLGAVTDRMSARSSIPYRDIPGFITPTVDFHSGMLFCAGISGREILVFSGRIHTYEGYGFDQVAFYVKVLKCLGIQKLILTNAAGSIHPDYRPGDFMLIVDHINISGGSPLRGEFDESLLPSRFCDMTKIYPKEMRQIAIETAEKLNIPLRKGVYAFMPGPQYETPAEVRALRILGADAVGMSTVPEAIMAAACGISVLGISYICNLGAGMTEKPITHEEISENSRQAAGNLFRLLCGVFHEI